MPSKPALRPPCAVAVLAALLVGSACSDHARRTTGVAAEPPRLNVLVPDGMTLQCPPRLGVSPRVMATGTGADGNGNGVICDERIGPPVPSGSPPAGPVVTFDDASFPAPAAGEP